MILTGLGLAAAGVFRLDCPLAAHACRARFNAGHLSWHTYAHTWAGAVVVLALLGTPFALARALWPTPIGVAALIAGAVGIDLAIAGEVVNAVVSRPSGVAERLELLVAHIWVWLVAGGVLWATRRPPWLSQPTPMSPREFFAAAWVGEGAVTSRAPLLGRLFPARFTFQRRARFASDQVWVVDDNATLASGDVLAQHLICELEPSGRIRITGDYLPGGAEVVVDDRGYRLAAYRYVVELGPLHVTVRCREQHTLEPDGTITSSVDARWLGIPVARMRARARRSEPPPRTDPALAEMLREAPDRASQPA